MPYLKNLNAKEKGDDRDVILQVAPQCPQPELPGAAPPALGLCLRPAKGQMLLFLTARMAETGLENKLFSEILLQILVIRSVGCPMIAILQNKLCTRPTLTAASSTGNVFWPRP